MGNGREKCWDIGFQEEELEKVELELIMGSGAAKSMISLGQGVDRG